jgi:hypothetical protein
MFRVLGETGMNGKYGCGLAAAGLLAVSQQAQAFGVADDVGLNDLIARLGAANTPTGDGVVVAQVEAPEGVNYGPNQALPDFTGKTFTAMSGAPGNSGHATLVAQNMYGSGNGIITPPSIAPGVATIFLYEANGWIGDDYLNAGIMPFQVPLITPGGIKFINNSWIGSAGGATNDILRRADFAADRDEVLIISGVNNGGAQQPLMCHSYNGLSVGLMGGGHTSGPTGGGVDGAGRMKPEIVAPGGLTSFATPIVDAAGSLVMQTINDDPVLSLNVNAKRIETLKAVLLGGANHRAGWSNNPATSGPNRGITATPLDPVFGADLVNVNTSHRIITTAEQNGPITIPEAANIINRGWDLAHVPQLGKRYWRFHVGEVADKVSILATWNRMVASNMASFNVANMTLTLWRVDEKGQLATLVGDPGLPYFSGGNVVSQSGVDNIEHLFITGLQPGDYVIELKRLEGLVGNWDAGVAWLLPQRAGDIDGDGFVNIDDLLAVIGSWGACPDPCLPHCPADVVPDCTVDVNDLLTVINFWD